MKHNTAKQMLMKIFTARKRRSIHFYKRNQITKHYLYFLTFIPKNILLVYLKKKKFTLPMSKYYFKIIKVFDTLLITLED